MNNEDKDKIVWQCRKRNALGLPWTLTKYVLFSDRLVIRTGLFSLVEKEVDLYKIIDKQISLPFLGRLFNYGTITCKAKMAFAETFEIKNIKSARNFLGMFDNYVDVEKHKYRVKGRDMIGGTDSDCDHELEE